MTTPIESFTVNHGFDAYGNFRQSIVENDQVITKTTFDAEPLMKQAHAERVATDGKRWGEGIGTKVGTVPMAIYAKALMMDSESRQQYLLQWLRDNPAFVTFNGFLK